uniref:Nuclear receptor domain-containing protein n=1 Tax=Rhabditophanes sp. KR3021 TaxID=114890 RepID=A0AC35UFP3_9BILA
MISQKLLAFLNKQNEDECLCCGYIGKGVGVRCQVNSCRPCANFFKKTIALGLEYRCRRGNQQCEIKSGTQKCRFCRFQKCTKAGMILKIKKEDCKENESKKDVSLMKNINPTIPSTSSSEYSYNENSSDDQFYLKETQLYIKHHKVVEIITAIISGPPLLTLNSIFNPIYSPTCLQRMAICLQQFFDKWEIKPKEEIKINTPISFVDFIEFRTQSFKFHAEILMSLSEFNRLCHHEKTLIYRKFWPRFDEFSNVMLALQIFGYEGETCMIIVQNDQALEIGSDNKFPDKFFTEDPFERRTIMRHDFEFYMTELYRPFKKLKLDQIELSYLVTQILWSHKRRDDLSESTFCFMDSILKSAASELQNYYIYEKQIDNYSWRLVEITKYLAVLTQSATSIIDNIIKAKIMGQFGSYKWFPNNTVLCPLD